MNGFSSKLYSFGDWIIKLIYLNILWITFTLMGLIVFGLFPSTAAMFSITRKWIMSDTDIPIFKSFWESYRKEFIKVNILGIVLLLIGYLLYIDLKFFQSTEQALLQPLYYVFLVLIAIFLVVLLYFFPVYVHYEFKLLTYIKYSFIAAIGNIFQTIVMVIGSIVVYYLFTFIPGLIPFFGGSLVSIVLMAIASMSFPKMKD